MAERSRSLGRQLDARIAKGLARRHHGKLRKAVELRVLAAFKMLQRIEPAHLRRRFDFQIDVRGS